MEPFDMSFNDVETFEDFIVATYSRQRILSRSGRFSARLQRHLVTPQVAVDDIAYTFGYSYFLAAEQVLVVTSRVGGMLSNAPGREEEHLGSGDVALVGIPGQEFGGVTVPNSRYNVTAIEPELLTQILLGRSATDDTAHVQFLDTRPVSRPAGAVLEEALHHVLHAQRTLPSTPLLADASAQYLATTLLVTFPHELIPDGRSPYRPGRDAHPQTVRRAMAYVNSHPDEPLTVGDMAAAAGVGPRALQIAFRRHLNITPRQYLRRVRLDLARRDLLAGTYPTVAETAMRWGCGSQSRFAALYRSAYGESPVQTLRSVRRP